MEYASVVIEFIAISNEAKYLYDKWFFYSF